VSQKNKNKKYAGLGPDGDARDPFNAQDGAAAPDGALWVSDHRLRLRRLQGQVPAARPRRQVRQRGT